MSVLYSPKKPDIEPRLLIVPSFFGALILILALRLWFFQVVISPELTDRSYQTDQASAESPAPRGLIYDTNGELLAGVAPKIVVEVIPKYLKKNPLLLSSLAMVLGTTEKSLQTKLKRETTSANLPTPVFIGATISQAAKITEQSDQFPGVSVDTQPMRFYPDSTDLTHILGYVWSPDQSDVKRLEANGLQVPQYVGKSGVEWKYEADLMGAPGRETVEVGKKSQPLKVVQRDLPTPGDRLNLTIDLNLQKIATKALAGKVGAVVAIDPSTGGILCMVSAPTYDSSLFESGISDEDYSKLRDDPEMPFENRAVNGFYAPGSAFKIVTSIAMERQGILDPNKTVFCDGAFHIGKGKIDCLGHHGAISYIQAFEKSCNTYFCQMGVNAGQAALKAAANDVGLGEKTDIDIRSETSAGVIPDPKYVEKVRKPGHWFGGDTANVAIGQGFVLVSPLQMADVLAVVGNRGVLYQPHLLKSIRKPGATMDTPFTPKVLRKVDLPESFWNLLITAMRGVIEVGTGRLAQIPGLDWGGKSGSAEHGHGLKANAWFVGLAPLNNPRIAIAVVVESIGHGGDYAAPIAKQVVQAYFKEDKRLPAVKQSATNLSTTSARTEFPSAR